MRQVSRRVIVGSIPSATVYSAVSGFGEMTSAANLLKADDVVTQRCQRWLRWQAEVTSLQLEWSRIEHQLAKRHPGFFKFSEKERTQLPDGGGRLAEIDARNDELYALLSLELPRLPMLKSTSIEAVLAKLSVVTELLHPDEYPEGHRLVADSIVDLTLLWPATPRT